MKKNTFILITCFFYFSINGMETEKTADRGTDISIRYYKTDIILTTKSCFELSNAVDIIAVGKNQQLLQKKNNKGYEFNTGTIEYPKKNILYATDDYKNPHYNTIHLPKKKNLIFSNQNEKKEKRVKKKANCTVFTIVEPILISSYFRHKRRPKVEHHLYHYRETALHKITEPSPDQVLYSKTARKTSSHHLIHCYKKILTEALDKLGKKPNKHIALATLSINTGFSPEKAANIAFGTIMDFIQTNRDAENTYKKIYFFVEKESDYNFYKKYFKNYQDMLHKICLIFYGKNSSAMNPISFCFNELPTDIKFVIFKLFMDLKKQV